MNQTPRIAQPTAGSLESRRAFMGATAAMALSPSAGLTQGVADQLPAGSHRLLLEAPGLGATPEPVVVHVHRPKGWTPDRPIALVMHGLQRDADRYLADWMPLAEASGVLVAVPEFSNAKFPRRSSYNFGGVVDDRNRPRPRSAWVFGIADSAFDLVRSAAGASASRFALYGHSAGAQFVHRYLLLAPRSRAALIISANAGSYTVPDFEVPFPWGLKDTEVSADDLRQAFARPVVIALGDRDTDPADPSLPKDAAAQAQGAHRLARGRHFFERARQAAAALEAPFNWHLEIVPGVAHSDAGMGPAAVRWIQALPQADAAKAGSS